ncbi:MAG: hypothetical protein AMJ69_05030 [Gammaproteobacteria bacterium SG8_47]|nr:MAG: hypothetical protein AMJ69_05030 [Gammaproteobacteria bacterium SG8_47]
MSEENLLRILTVFDSTEESEALINALRSAGQIVRGIRAEDVEDIQAALDEQPIDLVLLRHGTPGVSANDVMEAVGHAGRDVPLVVIVEEGKEADAFDALHAGARDIVAGEHTDHFRHVVTREIGDLRERRNHRQCEKMLRETEKRARSLIDTSRDAIAYVHDGMHIYANQAYLKMFGYEDEEDIQGMPILDMVSSDDHSELKEFLRKYSSGKSSTNTLEVLGEQANGKTLKIMMEFSPASMEGEACTQIIIRDQSMSQELEKKLNVLSKQDLLTGLYNRTYFFEQFDRLISRALDGQTKGALFHVAIDNFKAIRDNVGISGADLVLADIANVLKEKLQPLGTLARLEGPVFTLMVENVDGDQAQQLANKICQLLDQHMSDVGGQTVRCTASIGIALCNETTGTAHQCLQHAEKATEAAIQGGGNRAHLHNPAIEELAEKERYMHWASLIKDALQKNSFRLLYQPIVSLHGEPGEHYEVLLRMLGSDGAEVQPTEFLPAAEKMGLMIYIDRWVIANALTILAERTNSGKHTTFFIKLSAAALLDDKLLPWISERIKSVRLPAERLVFEISEPTALNYLKQAKNTIAGLRQLHCRFALDHFGVEPKTFESLNHLDVDFLKLDGGLINNLAADSDNQDKVKNIAEQARNMGKQTIASFVEDANSLAVLWQCSIDFIQGYFLQEPDVSMSYDFSEQ